MKRMLISLNTDDRSIEYSIDIEAASFESALTGADGLKTIVQAGAIGPSDSERQDLALRIYHILLAALRAQ